MIDASLTMVVAYLTALRSSASRALSQDRGLGTLEVIVLALGLFTAAGLAVAVIANAISNRTSQIN